MPEQNVTPDMVRIDGKEEVEIDLLAILRRVFSHRRTLYKAAAIGAVIGILTFIVLSIVALVTYRNTKSYKDEEGFM